MAKTVAIIQARTGSSRLPGKVLLLLGGQPLLELMVQRLRRSKRIDQIVIATTDNKSDDQIARFAGEKEIAVFRGSEQDVLLRFVEAARHYQAETVLRLTADCPLIDPAEVDRIVEAYYASCCDYASNVLHRTYPRGMDAEVFGMDVLERVHRLATSDSSREHVTTFIRNERSDLFVCVNVEAEKDDSDLQLTVDTAEDFALFERIAGHFGRELESLSCAEVVEWLRKQPEETLENSGVKRKHEHELVPAGEFSIAGRSVGGSAPCLIIAEMSANHGGRLEQALELVRVAADCGADALKLQTYTADSLTIDCDRKEFLVHHPLWGGQSLYNLYQKAAMPAEWHEAIFEECKKHGLICFSTPFDAEAVDLLESLNAPAHKVASFEIVDLELLHKVGSTGKPVILSAGMSSGQEIDEALRVLRKAGCSDIVLLKCTSSYPAPHAEMNLRMIPEYADTFKVVPGLSDHSPGTIAAVTAVALGAKVVEKHFVLSREDDSPDAAFSLTPPELKQLVTDIRDAEAALGSKHAWGASGLESSSLVFRRSVCAIRDIKKGEAFTRENVRVIRPGHGLKPSLLPVVLRSKSARNIGRGEGLREDDLTG